MPVNFTVYRRGSGNTGRVPGEAQPVPTLMTAPSEHISTAASRLGEGWPSAPSSSRCDRVPADPRMVPKTRRRFPSLLVSQAQGILKTEDACAGLITEHVSVTAVISINYFPKAGSAAFLQRPDPGCQPYTLGFGVDGAAFICFPAGEGWIYPLAVLTARGLSRRSTGRRRQDASSHDSRKPSGSQRGEPSPLPAS